MTEHINEGNKIIAEYDGWEKDEQHPNSFDHRERLHWFYPMEMFMYHSSWDWQIPVWAKLWNEYRYMVISENEYNKYNFHVSNDNPEAGFEIIVSILKRISDEKNS